MVDHDGFSFAFSEQSAFVSSAYFAVLFPVSDVLSAFPPFHVYVLYITPSFHIYPLLADGSERKDLAYGFPSAFLWISFLHVHYLSHFAS